LLDFRFGIKLLARGIDARFWMMCHYVLQKIKQKNF